MKLLIRNRVTARSKGGAKSLVGLWMVLSLTACSRTLTWEEEVPLNTGETLVLKRAMEWRLQGGAGNPFNFGMRPDVDKQVLEFRYRDKDYVYSGGAAVGWIAISKEGLPVLVATPADWGWAVQNHYYCIVPFYVQFVPDATGRRWTWVRPIEPWLYGLPYNVLASFPKLDENVKQRYVVADRVQRDTMFRLQQPERTMITPDYKSRSCIADPASKQGGAR